MITVSENIFFSIIHLKPTTDLSISWAEFNRKDILDLHSDYEDDHLNQSPELDEMFSEVHKSDSDIIRIGILV